MAFDKLNQEKIMQAIPEDVKRYFKREIEKCNKVSTAVHYKFAHYLLTKYEAIMDIWVASESSASEIEEIRKAHEFCLKATDDDNNLIWICEDCKSVVSVFRQVIPGITEGEFTQYLLAMIESCPSCGGFRNSLVKSGFLLSGLNLELTLRHELGIEADDEVMTNNLDEHLIWIVLRQTYPDLKECHKQMVGICGGLNPILNMIKEGQIEYIFHRADDKGNYWDVFGKMTPDDIKRFGDSEKAKMHELQRKLDKKIVPKVLDPYLRSKGYVNGIKSMIDFVDQQMNKPDGVRWIKEDICAQESVDILSNNGTWYINHALGKDETTNALYWLASEEMEIPWNLRACLLDDQSPFRFLNQGIKMRWINGNFEEIGRV